MPYHTLGCVHSNKVYFYTMQGRHQNQRIHTGALPPTNSQTPFKILPLSQPCPPQPKNPVQDSMLLLVVTSLEFPSVWVHSCFFRHVCDFATFEHLPADLAVPPLGFARCSPFDGRLESGCASLVAEGPSRGAELPRWRPSCQFPAGGSLSRRGWPGALDASTASQAALARGCSFLLGKE